MNALEAFYNCPCGVKCCYYSGCSCACKGRCCEYCDRMCNKGECNCTMCEKKPKKVRYQDD